LLKGSFLNVFSLKAGVFDVIIEFPLINLPNEGNYTIQFYLLIQNLFVSKRNYNIGEYAKLFIKSGGKLNEFVYYTTTFPPNFEWKEINENFTANGTQLFVIDLFQYSLFFVNYFNEISFYFKMKISFEFGRPIRFKRYEPSNFGIDNIIIKSLDNDGNLLRILLKSFLE
jgi:hypothetical protein